MPNREQALKTTRELIAAPGLKTRHRATTKAFTRERSLTFPLVLRLLLCSDLSTAALCERLTALFHTSPTTDRPQRNPPRTKSSSRTLLNFHKRRKEHCY
jgi:hypothetical protein